MHPHGPAPEPTREAQLAWLGKTRLQRTQHTAASVPAGAPTHSASKTSELDANPEHLGHVTATFLASLEKPEALAAVDPHSYGAVEADRWFTKKWLQYSPPCLHSPLNVTLTLLPPRNGVCFPIPESGLALGLDGVTVRQLPAKAASWPPLCPQNAVTAT